MSWVIAGSCWDMELRPHQMLVLVAMADHADHDGRNVFPGIRMIAWKTGLAKRSVYRIQKELRDMGVLVRAQSDACASGKAVYEIDLDAVALKTGYPGRRRRMRVRGGGDTVSPPSPDGVSSPPLTPAAQGGDASGTPVRTVTVQEPPPPPADAPPGVAGHELTEVVVSFLNGREKGGNGQPPDEGLLGRFRRQVEVWGRAWGDVVTGGALVEFEEALRRRPNAIVHPIDYVEPIVARHKKAAAEEAQADRQMAEMRRQEADSSVRRREEARVALADPTKLRARAYVAASIRARLNSRGGRSKPTDEEWATAEAAERAKCERIVDGQPAAVSSEQSADDDRGAMFARHQGLPSNDRGRPARGGGEE